MLVNAKKEGHVEFISYSGHEPSLCSGKLTLRIDGKEYVFSPSKTDLPKFWYTGGSCGFAGRNYTNPYINKGEWEIDAAKLPGELQPYAHEIDAVFNENVEHGCCGGCL